MAELSDKPLVSIVTPSYNQGQFIEDTILSVKNQDYPNIEHIIVDGGSTDNTLEILKKYEGTYNMRWVSEPDEGQADAINKGFMQSRGQILAWLNADDTYLFSAVSTAVAYLIKHLEADLVYGNIYIIDEQGNELKICRTVPYDIHMHLAGVFIVPQQAAFWRREAFFRAGMLNPKLQFSLDGELWLKMAKMGMELHFIDKILANFRMHPASKTVSKARLAKEESRQVKEVILGRRLTWYDVTIKYWYFRVRKRQQLIGMRLRKLQRVFSGTGFRRVEL